MNGIKEILLTSSILIWSTPVLAESLEVQTELQKNKELVFTTLHNKPLNHVVWKNNLGMSLAENKVYFQNQALSKIKLPITEDISWGVFRSQTSWHVVWVKYKLNSPWVQSEQISVWIWKNNKAEITYSFKF